jgi:hypothetical protein
VIRCTVQGDLSPRELAWLTQEYSRQGGLRASGTASRIVRNPSPLRDRRARSVSSTNTLVDLVSAATAANEEELCYCYLDAFGVEQGPFGYDQLLAWYMAGYMDGDVTVRKLPLNEFTCVKELFEKALVDELQVPVRADWTAVVRTRTDVPSCEHNPCL